MEQRHLDISEMKSIFFLFMHFVFFDVNGKRWISSSLKCKPVATSNLFKKKKNPKTFTYFISVLSMMSRQYPLADRSH